MVKKMFHAIPALVVMIALVFYDLPWYGGSIFFFGEPKHPDLH